MKRASWIGLLMIGLGGAAEAAIAPPPGFDTWIYHGATACGDGAAAVNPCAGSATGFLAIEDRTSVPGTPDSVRQIGGGSITANTLHGFAESTSAFNKLFLAIRDTYTLSGPAGEVTITPQLTVEGHAMRIAPRPGAAPVGDASIIASIGTDLGANGTSILGSDAGGQDKIPPGVGPLSADLFVAVSTSKTVMTNEPFMLAFLVELSNTGASRLDALNTATISFDIPTGYILTSELGWTPVPLPSAFVLFALSCGALLKIRTQT